VNVAVQGQTGAQPEGAFLNFVNWIGNVIAPVGAGVAVLGAVGSYATGRGVFRWLVTAAGLLVSGLTRLLEFWIAQGGGGVSQDGSEAQEPRKTGRRVRDSRPAGLSIWAARQFHSSTAHSRWHPFAAGPCGTSFSDHARSGRDCIAARRHDDFLDRRGGFSNCMFCAVVLITLPQGFGWFAFWGVGAPLPRRQHWQRLDVGIREGRGHLREQLCDRDLVPVLAAWMVLRSVIDFSEGCNPLASILGAMFLLAIPATAAVLRDWNDGTRLRAAHLAAGWASLPVLEELAHLGLSLRRNTEWLCRRPPLARWSRRTTANYHALKSAMAAVGRNGGDGRL
jgi:hypothetical protein